VLGVINRHKTTFFGPTAIPKLSTMARYWPSMGQMNLANQNLLLCNVM